MAKSKVKKIAETQRPINTTRNDFSDTDGYTQDKAVSPMGRGENGAGEIGTSIDIVQRKNNISKNTYNFGNTYSVED